MDPSEPHVFVLGLDGACDECGAVLGYGNHIDANLFDQTPPRARWDDPGPSHEGARRVEFSAKTQCARLLAEYAKDPPGGMNQHEAGAAAGMRTGYWKRISELHLWYGLIEPTGEERATPSVSTVEVAVYRITPRGRAYAKHLGLV